MSHSNLDAPSVKTCFDCGQTKPIAQFSKNKTNRDGLHSYCKPCASARYRQWRLTNQDRRNDYMRQWHADHLEHETRYARERYRNDEEYRRNVLGWLRQYRQKDAVRQRHWLRKKAKGFRNDIVRAHTTVSRAVRRGLLPPAWTMVCDTCQEAQAHDWHHHMGYERKHWLDVVALCLDCHGRTQRSAK